MRQWLRKILVYGVTVAFVLSGAAWRDCVNAPAQAAIAVVAHDHNHQSVSADAHAAHHGETHAGSSHVADAASNTAQPPAHDGACLKCCSVCTVATFMPAIAATPVDFSSASVSYRTDRHDLAGSIVALDPGIPKRIV